MKKILKFLFLVVGITAASFFVLGLLSTEHSQEPIAQLEQKTIDDFGYQWATHKKNEGYYASNALFQDILGPDFSASLLKGKVVVDVGSGSGRIVRMISREHPARIHAVEPALGAYDTLRENTQDIKNIITYHNKTGSEFVVEDADYIISLGMIHHIPDPVPTMRNIYKCLKPGGKAVIWLYAHEGNELYLSIFQPIRRLTVHMNNTALTILSKFLTVFLSGYITACDYLPLPMHVYMVNHLKPFSWENRYLTVFDQLNPAWAKYYYKEEALKLMEDAGFKDVKIHYRHGYSWTVVGTK